MFEMRFIRLISAVCQFKRSNQGSYSVHSRKHLHDDVAVLFDDNYCFFPGIILTGTCDSMIFNARATCCWGFALMLHSKALKYSKALASASFPYLNPRRFSIIGFCTKSQYHALTSSPQSLDTKNSANYPSHPLFNRNRGTIRSAMAKYRLVKYSCNISQGAVERRHNHQGGEMTNLNGFVYQWWYLLAVQVHSHC